MKVKRKTKPLTDRITAVNGRKRAVNGNKFFEMQQETVCPAKRAFQMPITTDKKIVIEEFLVWQ